MESTSTKTRKPRVVAVVGATGVVGRETLSILHDRRFPASRVIALASERSVGSQVEFGDDELTVELARPEAFDGVDLAFFAAGGATSKALIPEATRRGTMCIDKSSAYRLDPEVPLVVPEVNGAALAAAMRRKIVATPNCSTIQLVQALAPLERVVGIRRVIVTTYQAVSGAGKAGVDELEQQVRALFNMREIESTSVFGQRIAFNVLPCIPGNGGFDASGASEEERKMMLETQKILARPDLRVGVTCARVPVFNGHSEAVHLELARPVTVEEARELLAAAPNLLLIDEPAKGVYPTPQDATGEDRTLVGRVRLDPAHENGLALWIASDNLRTGAALTAVRIAETLLDEVMT